MGTRSRTSSLVTIPPMPRDTDNPTVTNLTMRWMNLTTRARNGSWSQGSASREPSKAVENHETSCEALEKLSYEWREECNDDAKFCWRIAGEPSNADVLRTVYGVDPAIGASQDCKSENTNADNNNDMASFYYRCATEAGSNPLRSRCKYCEWVEGEIKRCQK